MWMPVMSSSGYAGHYHLDGGVARIERARACTGCDAGLALCSVAITQGRGLLLSCCGECPEGRAQAGSVPFKCMFFLLPALGLVHLQRSNGTACVGSCSSAQMQPKVLSFPHFGHPRSSARLWCGVGGAGAFAQLALGVMALWLWELKQLCCYQPSGLLL